ncbi:MAG TPA: ribonuclease III [Phenylobacterium sp.]|jgi:ribonuclease-3|uniref:ribonuclease III n=1 Tax=Phenylobacterium sp. TaxID=1871053 RepID=UPI002D64AAF6|nr:ribonuclease III [Phenylobacterium sp.]HZZ67474.1 ribonuclease III [Phenylobacterium sp.]
MNTRIAAIAELERRIGHSFADRALLERALTHGSVSKGSAKIGNNERLEFLGDRVLNLAVAEQLMRLRPEASEGALSKLMNQLVNYRACADAARRAGLRDALRVDASATKIGARDNERVLGDACEALIAALYLDAGFDAARAFILAFWADLLDHLDAPTKDPKTMLQEWAMARGLPLPDYRVIRQDGSAHEPVFTIEVGLPGLEPMTAVAGSKREAERLAADAMLTRHAGPEIEKSVL